MVLALFFDWGGEVGFRFDPESGEQLLGLCWWMFLELVVFWREEKNERKFEWSFLLCLILISLSSLDKVS